MPFTDQFVIRSFLATDAGAVGPRAYSKRLSIGRHPDGAVDRVTLTFSEDDSDTAAVWTLAMLTADRKGVEVDVGLPGASRVAQKVVKEAQLAGVAVKPRLSW